MAKKRKKRSGKNGGWGWLGDAARGMGWLFVKVFPMLVIVSLTGGLFLGVKKLLYADPSLAIRNVTVEPPTALAIGPRAALEKELLGRNILKINLKRISRELEKNPQIHNARVIRNLPVSIKIEIEKRQPVAFIQFAPRGPYGLVSDDGMILDVFAKPDVSFVLIEAYGMGLGEPQIGMQIKSRGFLETIKFIEAYWTHPLSRREAITKLQIDHLSNLTVTLGVGPAIKLGRYPIERLKDLEKIVHLLDNEGREKIEYVDLEFDNVIVKRRGK